MKYLKNFENTIKHSDPIAINHPLAIFSRKLEDIIIDLKNFDNFKNTVRRYFNDNESISISYKGNSSILKIYLNNDNENVYLKILSNTSKWYNNESENGLEFSEFISNQLSKYKYNINLKNPHYMNIEYKFKISEMFNILSDIQFDKFLNYRKYNL